MCLKVHIYICSNSKKIKYTVFFQELVSTCAGVIEIWYLVLTFVAMPHVKIFIILMKKNFQRCAVAHGVAFHMYILEVGSLLLWKFGLGCYTPFCSSLTLRAAADGKHDIDSYSSRTE